MIIYTICVDPARGRFLAFSGDDPDKRAFSHVSEVEAAGQFIVNVSEANGKTIAVDGIVSIDTREPSV